jgi:hypothetical protein
MATHSPGIRTIPVGTPSTIRTITAGANATNALYCFF